MVLGCPTSARYITKYLLPESSRPLCWEHFLGSLVKPVLLRETRCNLILRLKASSNTQARSVFSFNRVKLFQKEKKYHGLNYSFLIRYKPCIGARGAHSDAMDTTGWSRM